MPNIQIAIIVVGFLCGLPLEAFAGDSRRQGSELRKLSLASEFYFFEKEHYPESNSDSTWFEKMVDGGYIESSMLRFGLTPDGSLPLDKFGFPVIYEPPKDPTTQTAVFRSVGPNGVDDQGGLDDWDIRHGPNLGYWYKSLWPAVYRRAMYSGVIAFFGSICILFFTRNRRAALILSLLFTGLVGSVVMPYGLDAGVYPTSASTAPRWFNATALISACIVLIGLVMILTVLVRMLLSKSSYSGTVCKCCAYDLSGSPTTVCPECGTDQSTPSGNRRLPSR